MRRSVLAVFLVALIGAFTGAENRTTSTGADISSMASSTSTTSTAVPTTTTSAAVTTTTDPGPETTRAGYVPSAVGDVQSLAPDGRVMVVADGEQICVQALRSES
jgi:predicted small secreted protein